MASNLSRRRNRRPAPLLAVLPLAGLLVAGCSGPAEDADQGATPSPTPAVAGNRVPDEGPLDHDQGCAAMYVSGETPLERRIGEALVGASETYDAAAADKMHVLALELGTLQTRLPDDLAAALDKVRVPFVQLQEGIDAGTSESVELDIASATEGLKEFRALCS